MNNNHSGTHVDYEIIKRVHADDEIIKSTHGNEGVMKSTHAKYLLKWICYYYYQIFNQIMKRVELKRIADFLWKGSPADEKTPFAVQGTLPDNGSFSKNFDSGEDIKSTKEFLESGDENLSEPMSIPRKFCFVMSFNVWILYFLVLGWLIPCKDLKCSSSTYPDTVETNLSSISLLTNIETMNKKGLPSLAMIGYGDGTELKLSALATFDAVFEWNNSLPFIPRRIQCSFWNVFDANGDGIPDCLLLGYNDIYAFNVTNGYVFWHQNIPSEEGDILSGFHPTVTRNDETYLLGACGDKLVIVNARNGTKVSEVSLPCESPSSLRIVSNRLSDNVTLWNLVCDYGDKVEAWNFEEQDLLDGMKTEKKLNNSEFSLLFNGANSGGSIDLGCDVTPIPGGPLLLSWSDRVVMVTQEAIAWERHFPEPLTVASIEVGHFSNAKELQIAAAVRNSTSTIVFILEMKKGTVVDSIVLKDRLAESLEKLSDDVDSFVLQSLYMNYTTLPAYNTSDPVPVAETNFVLINFRGGSFKVKDIVTTAEVARSTLNMQTNGETDLLVIKTENGFTSYLKYVLHNIISPDNIICSGNGNSHRRSSKA